MIKAYLSLLLLAVTSVSHAIQLPSNMITNVPVGSWGIDFGRAGEVGLNCRESRSYVNCEMTWFFASLRVSAIVENDVLKVYTGKDKKDALLISLKNGLPHKFMQGGMLSAEYFTHYSSKTFKDLNGRKMLSYQAFKNKVNNIYYERGSLKELPASIPAWIINPSMHLFKNEKVGSYIGKSRVLSHQNLSPKTLDEMYTFFSSKKKSYPIDLVIIARNPSTSKHTLETLFNTPAKNRLYTHIWNAVSSNPSSPSTYKAIYYDRIRKGTEKTHIDFLGDKLAPPELLDWVARNSKYTFFRSQMYSNPNVSADTLDYLFDKRSNDEDKRTITSHSNISDSTLLKLAKAELKSKHDQSLILEIIIRNKNKGKEATKIALSRLAKHKDINRKSKAAKDNRLSREFIDLFARSESINLRSSLARNNALNYSDLVTLAKDEYSYVSRPARDQLTKRFRKESAQLITSLPPLSSLRKGSSLHSVLEQNIRSNDIEATRKTIQSLLKTEQSTNANINSALENNNKEMLLLLAETNTYNFNQLIRNKYFNTEWLGFFLDNNMLKQESHAKAFQISFKNKRLDYAQTFIDRGYDINEPTNHPENSHLHIAIYAKSESMLDFMLANNINIHAINPKSRKSPLALARKMRFIYAIEKLDKKGAYVDEVAEFKKEYTPDKKSLLIGDWSNLKGEFKTSLLKLNSDGSGRMMGVVVGALMVWQQVDSSTLEMTPNINGVLNKSKTITFKYELDENILTLWPIDKKHNKVVYFRQNFVPESLTVSDDNSPIDEKYIGLWFNDNKKLTLTIKPDSTAYINKTSKLDLKKGAGDYVLAFRSKSKKINKQKPLTLILNKTRNILTVAEGRRVFEFKRISKK